MVDLPGPPLWRKLTLPPQHPSTVNDFWPGLGTCERFVIPYAFLCRILDLVALEYRRKQYWVQTWNHCSIGSKCGLPLLMLTFWITSSLMTQTYKEIENSSNVSDEKRMHSLLREQLFLQQLSVLESGESASHLHVTPVLQAKHNLTLITRCQQYPLVRVTSKNIIQRFPKDS